MADAVPGQAATVDGQCRICGGRLRETFRSQLPVSVSSACFPVDRSTGIVQCLDCDLFQKTDATLCADYLHYEVFDNDPLADKMIFKTGQPHQTRSQLVADLLLARLEGCRAGRILEVGCQRGAFLSALKARGPGLDLYGFDLDPQYVRLIEPICGAGHYYSGELDDVPGSFDACVLIHTLEHIPYPGRTLQTLHRLLVPGGLLVIVVPDVLASPLDFYVIDHTCHFVAPVLERTLSRAGFAGRPATDIIPNEMVAIARSVTTNAAPTTPLDAFDVPILTLLRRLESCLRRLPKGPAHVFGTAVIGVLVSGILGADCIGFVDESPFQVGKEFLGRMVRSPTELAGQRVVLGVAESLAPAVRLRLEALGAEVVNPWELAE